MKPRIAVAGLFAFAGLNLLAAQPVLAADAPRAASTTATAIFAGGCFWCTEADFEKLPGVISAESGYTDGKTANPSYEEVSSGATGHTEAVRIVYDPARVTYAQLLDHLWHNIDPTVKDRQFCDYGSQYRSGIYWQTEAERKAAEDSRDALLKSGKVKQIHTEIKKASEFYPAEGYHQDYYKKNPIRYNYYRSGCGRDIRLQQLWGVK
ncbi:MAG: peptide-methionine (S)-S-oxide reductase MsrA [Zoogloeaceae bacterium]|nr:peptide-methionine (S)-S-oxide reductase MsrA [Zoogloeaceae bacterium]